MSSNPMDPAGSLLTEAASQARVARILARARGELGVRDLLALAVGSLFSGLLVVGAMLYVLFRQRLQ